MNPISKIEQRTPEWFECRLGKVTASKTNDVMAILKSGGEAATRKNYRAQLVCERLTGTKQDTFINAAMQWGTDAEPLARSAYESYTGDIVNELGFIDHPYINMSGASPDGLVGEDGMIEIKCPNTSTHMEWLISGVVPPEHHNQMLWQMACAGRKWCDFVSFDPRMPTDLQLMIVRLNRDDDRIELITQSVIKFLSEVDDMINKLTKLQKSAEPKE
jgi:putative phage-type endonuclease